MSLLKETRPDSCPLPAGRDYIEHALAGMLLRKIRVSGSGCGDGGGAVWFGLASLQAFEVEG